MPRTRRFSSQLVPIALSIAALGGAVAAGWKVHRLDSQLGESREDQARLSAALAEEQRMRVALERLARGLEDRAEHFASVLGADLAARRVAGDDSAVRVEALERAFERSETGEAERARRLAALEGRAAAEAAAVAALRRRVDAVAPGSYDALLGPTVKLSSRSDVGSGTVLFSGKRGEGHVAYIVTAQHIVEQNVDARAPVPLDVISFQGGQKVREEKGVVVLADRDLDLALVEVGCDRPYEAVARLLPPERLDSVALYSRVHAIGCPLGYAPMPTSGELTSKSKVLDGQVYWMINAPTIFGNSGGGIFLADTGEMIGVLSRLSAYKNVIEVAVPHMGIVTSAGELCAWLEREGYGFVVGRGRPPEETVRASLAETRAGSLDGPAPRTGHVPARAKPGAAPAE
jgi:S1-C subfamily serine protease